MARHKKYESIEDANPQLDISSLIDVCFLLLIYFIVTSTISLREQDLGMALPGAAPTKGGEQPKIEPMLISIEASGTIFTGTREGRQQMDSDMSVRDVPLLSGTLELYASAARAAGSDPVVQINADPETSQQRVIDVLNALAGQKINTVTFTDLLE